MLINASMQTIETAEEAYAWLGNSLGPEADDSFVVTMFSVRVSLALLLFTCSFPVCAQPRACPALHMTTTNSCLHSKTLISPAD